MRSLRERSGSPRPSTINADWAIGSSASVGSPRIGLIIETMAGRVSSPVFVSRRGELAALAAAFGRAMEGQPSMVLIAGEAGIGKSRLVGELVHADRDGSARLALAGGCVRLGDTSLPFAPIVEVLRSLVAQVSPAALESALGPWAGDLARLAPNLGQPIELAPSEVLQPEWLQARIFEAFLGLLHRLGEEATVLLVIEDLHWADQSTRDLLAFLLRNLSTERLLIVVTFRSDDLHRRHPLLPWLAEIERQARVERLELARFDGEELRAQVEAILGGPASDELIETVMARSDGNPFFAEELVAIGARDARDRVPAALRELLIYRVAGLAPSTQSLLNLIAVAGRRVDHELLRAVAGMGEPELEEAIREAAGAQLLTVETTGTSEAYAFRHALVQEALYDEMLPSQRRRLHLAYAQALEVRGQGGRASAGGLAELAHHWAAAKVQARALEASLAAAEAAAREYAFAESGVQYERAIELWDVVAEVDRPVGSDLVGTLSSAALAVGLAGDPTRSLALSREAVKRLDAASDPERAALLEERLAWAATEVGDFETANAALHSAVGTVDQGSPSRAQARVLAGVARNLTFRGRDREAIPVAERAVAVARTIGARDVEGDALSSLGNALYVTGDCARMIDCQRQARAIAEEVGDAWAFARAGTNLSSTHWECGDSERAIELFDEGHATATRMGFGRVFRLFIHGQAWRLWQMGRWAEARARLEEIASLDLRGPRRIVYCRTLALIECMSGNRAAARRLLAEARNLVKTADMAPEWFIADCLDHALFAVLHGETDDARREVGNAIARLEEVEQDSDSADVYRLAIEVEADIAEGARARRDPKAAEGALARAVGFLDRLRMIFTNFGASPIGHMVAAELALGEAEMSRVEARPDPGSWAKAAAGFDERHRPYWSAYAHYRAGEALLSIGHGRADAERELRSAHSAASDLGARPLKKRVEGLARRARIDLRPAAAAVPAEEVLAHDVAPEPGHVALRGRGLSNREIEVLALVAAGFSNGDIGKRLFITRKTAAVHVTHILDKLGVSNRVEAAMVGVRLGMPDISSDDEGRHQIG
jgi:ATP/maltotriose-dependent transcriptional regulator MalT